MLMHLCFSWCFPLLKTVYLIGHRDTSHCPYTYIYIYIYIQPAQGYAATPVSFTNRDYVTAVANMLSAFWLSNIGINYRLTLSTLRMCKAFKELVDDNQQR